MNKFEHTTTDAAVITYESAIGVFTALLSEVRELSKKKPDATLSASKVKLINNVLNDLVSILEQAPEGKYLHILEDETLPQVSDALMMMVQFNAALVAFKRRYYQSVRIGYGSRENHWITEETLTEWDAEGESDEDGEGDDEIRA